MLIFIRLSIIICCYNKRYNYEGITVNIREIRGLTTKAKTKKESHKKIRKAIAVLKKKGIKIEILT